MSDIPKFPLEKHDLDTLLEIVERMDLPMLEAFQALIEAKVRSAVSLKKVLDGLARLEDGWLHGG